MDKWCSCSLSVDMWGQRGGFASQAGGQAGMGRRAARKHDDSGPSCALCVCRFMEWHTVRGRQPPTTVETLLLGLQGCR